MDTDAFRRTVSRLLDHLCAKTNSGMCINSIAKVAERVGDFWENTFVYDIHDFSGIVEGGDEEGGIEIMKKCDTFWYVYQTETRRRTRREVDLAFDFRELGYYTNNFYCDEYCREKRGIFYPCCLQQMLGDKKMWDDLHQAMESLYRIHYTLMSIGYDSGIPSFWTPSEDYPDKDFEKYIRKNGRIIRRAFLRLVDAGKYCESGRVECRDDF